MKIIGLVVEYNPFHEGHKTHIKQALSLDKDALLIAVMSPNFVQRGEVAILPKKDRVIDALNNGVDLVVELPTVYALESADIFAGAAISILNDLKVTDIVFGSETGDTEAFLKKYQRKEYGSPRLDDLIEDLMDQGYAYPKAYALANSKVHDFYLDNPNDILGFEYLKYIDTHKLDIKPHCYLRENNEKNKNSTSALSIREKLKKDKKNRYKFNFLDDYFDLVKYLLLTKSTDELSHIHLMDEGIENFLIKNIKQAHNMEEFLSLSTSKRYSAARIKRTICHLILNNNKYEVKSVITQKPPYIRVLGYNEKGQKYLSSLRKDEINICTRFAAREYPLLLNELKSTAVYFINKQEPEKSQLIEEEKKIFPIRL